MKKNRRIWYISLLAFLVVFFFAFLVGKVSNNNTFAASLSGFDPGYIISDYQMGNYKSMSEADIQNFLTTKNPCSNTNYSYYLSLSANKKYTWHWQNGHFVCLSEERFGDGEVIGSGQTAAHIIWQAAQDYRINPQVLIVLLQKETSLITDPIPNNGDYRKATGYGCPDTAPCSEKYYGFKNQVRKAAELFRTVLDGGWTNYPLGNNYIQYNPNSACGGSVVNIRSLATSALYRYTPYQPNAGALAAGYGTASCGAYGNRNFYLYFEDWFGGIKNAYSEKLGRTVPDGTYQILNYNNKTMVLDIYGGIRDGMTSENVITFNKKGANDTRENQTFEVVFNSSEGYYNIFNKVSGLYLSAGEKNVRVESKDTSCKQKWNLRGSATGVYEIVSACDGRSIDVLSNNETTLNNSGKKWRLFEISGETNALKDGRYQISPVLSEQLAIDINGGVRRGMLSGTISLWTKWNDKQDRTNQMFEVKYDSETGYYTIYNYISGLALDVNKGSRYDGANIITWQRNNNSNQQWMIRKEGNNYKLLSACSGMALDVPESNFKTGQGLIVFTSINNKKNQQWKFSEVVDRQEDFDGEYLIASLSNPGMVLDVEGGVNAQTRSGNIIMYGKKYRNNQNQIFKFKKTDEENVYNIYNPESNLYLDVYGGYKNNGTKIILWQQNGACNQKWRVIKNSNGFYSISSMCSKRVLDISNGVANTLAPVIIFDNHSGFNQQWILMNTK